MCPEQVYIQSLHLRVPSMSRAHAATFAEEVARGLEQGLSALQDAERIESMDLRITPRNDVLQNGLAPMVAERILLGLRR
jgi:hypothetical protein